MSTIPDLIHAYRHLYRAALRAVQFSKPARYSVRDQMRAGFRDRNGRLDPETVERTLEFLEAARVERGLEHRILKNLVRVTWERSKLAEKQNWGELLKERKRAKALLKAGYTGDGAYKHYDMTVAMLNQTMGLCLR